jgi:hypothetical protein
LSSPALLGASDLIEYFIQAAREARLYFVAGPVWNQADRLVAGETQYLRYAFDGIDTREVPFSTMDLEQYGLGDAAIKTTLQQIVAALVATHCQFSQVFRHPA